MEGFDHRLLRERIETQCKAHCSQLEQELDEVKTAHQRGRIKALRWVAMLIGDMIAKPDDQS